MPAAAETEVSLYTQLRRSLVESGEWDQYVFWTWLWGGVIICGTNAVMIEQNSVYDACTVE